MKTLQAFYNGTTIETVEEYPFERNQKLIITVLDDSKNDKKAGLKALRGSLAKYANPKLIEKESDAWANAVKEKYDLR